jgi:hypothetical protein
MLATQTGLLVADVMRIVANAPRRYKTYTIAKRNGDGHRVISQPAIELKALQRVLVDRVISRLPVHQSAMAYRPGLSVRANAARHAASNGPIFKFDFMNFFPSITSVDWDLYCRANRVFVDPFDLYISRQILFQQKVKGGNLALAIGAPSSPSVSNALMFTFDDRVAGALENDRVIYTRYADDLTFSAPRTGYLNRVEAVLRETIRDIKSPVLTINEKKTVKATKKYKRCVTGLILTNDGKVSIGQERKRKLRAEMRHYFEGKLSRHQQASLAGKLAFVFDVEPDLYYRIQAKYGLEILTRLKSVRVSGSADDEVR